jgi:nucleotide-binding universal stress UspA family protein
MRWPARNILCPTDLSEAGNAAVALAYELAGPGATVHLLHVDEPDVVTSAIGPNVLLFAADARPGEEETAQQISSRMRLLVPGSAATRGVRTEVHVVHEPRPVAVIQREAKRRAADLIVLGTHGRSGIAKALLGSVATAVLRQSTVPVVVFHDVAATR